MDKPNVREAKWMHSKGWLQRAGRALAACATLLVAIFTIGVALPASAAPTVTYPDAISNLSIVKEDGSTDPTAQWERVRIEGTWSVPDGAVAGETFGMTLPDEFSRYGSGAFSITDPDTGEVLAECQVADGAGPQLICTLTDAVVGHEDVGGDFWLSGIAEESTTSETVEFEVGDQIVVVDLPGDGGIIPEDTTEWGEPYKFASPTTVPGVIRWTVGIPSSYVSDGSFDVSDQLDPSLENHHYTGEVWLDQRPVVDGELVGEWTSLDASAYSMTFAPDYKSFEFVADGLPEGGYAYRLSYNTQADGVVLIGDVFGNTAMVGGTQSTAAHTSEVSGGGTGTGAEYTRFTIEKTIVGDQADAAQGSTFTVEYSVKGSDEPAKQMSVTVGQPVKSDRAPLGSTFIVEEVDLPEIANVEWGAWTLEGDGVVQQEDGSYEVTPSSHVGVSLVLQNEANAVPQVGALSWTKVDSKGASLSGSEWTLSGPGGDISVVDGGARDSDVDAGELTVTELPFGEYTLTETRAPEGYERTEQEFTVSLDAQHESAEFGAIVNLPTPPVVPPAIVPPVSGETPPTLTPTVPSPRSSPLATTGGLSPAFGVALGVVLLAGAAAAVSIEGRRKRVTSRDRV